MAQSCASVGSWVRTYGDWRGTLGSAGLGYDYVYAYATPEKHETSNENNDHLLVPKRVVDRVFYIGRGKNSRWIEHFKDFNQTVAMDDDEAEKRRLIREGLEITEHPLLEFDQGDLGRGLVRKIACFKGPFQVEQADAVEKFLISYWAGVYRLANLTRGNSQAKGLRFACRPISLMNDDPAWLSVAKKAAEWSGNGSFLSQIDTRAIVVAEVESSLDWEKINSTLEISGRLNLESGFTSNGTDAYFSYFVCDRNASPIMRMQLKLNDKELGVCINLRPLKNKNSEFRKLIADVFFNKNQERLLAPNGMNMVANFPGDPYFKPFAKRNGSRTQDIYFDFVHPESKRLAPWLQENMVSLSLIDAIDMVLKVCDNNYTGRESNSLRDRSSTSVIRSQPKTICSFCNIRPASTTVERWDTWEMRNWTMPACIRCAPKNQQTWFT